MEPAAVRGGRDRHAGRLVDVERGQLEVVLVPGPVGHRRAI
jgi:hypothetical protein